MGSLVNPILECTSVLPMPLQYSLKAVNVLRFGRVAKSCVYDIQENPASFAAGVITKLVLGDNLVVNAASQIALISRCTFELYDAQKVLIRTCQDLATVTDHVPIDVIQHACRQKNKNTRTVARTIICILPRPLAKTVVKMQDMTHLVASFSKAFWAYIAAWDALYCACYLNSLTKFSANIQVYTNIKASYTRLCEDGSYLSTFIKSSSVSINQLLRHAKVSITAEDLSKKITFSNQKIHLPSQSPSLFSDALLLLQKTAFTIIQLATNLPVSVTPLKGRPKQPILPKREIHGHNSGSHKTCKTDTSRDPRRFYCASE